MVQVNRADRSCRRLTPQCGIFNSINAPIDFVDGRCDLRLCPSALGSVSRRAATQSVPVGMHRICAAVCETAKTDSLVEGEGFKNPHLGRVRGKSLSRLPARRLRLSPSATDTGSFATGTDGSNPSPSATCASVHVGAGNKKLAKPAACREQHLSHRRQRCYYWRIQVGRLVTQSSWTNTIKAPAPVSWE